jgi:hypothetical protein
MLSRVPAWTKRKLNRTIQKGKGDRKEGRKERARRLTTILDEIYSTCTGTVILYPVGIASIVVVSHLIANSNNKRET